MSLKLNALMALTHVFWLVAFSLMLIGMVLCDFVKFTAETASESEAIVSRGFGLWWYRSWSTYATASADGTAVYLVEACAAYPASWPLGVAWHVARAFSVCALLLALLLLLLKCGVAWTPDRVAAVSRARIAAPLFFATAVCEGLTLVFLRGRACRDNELVALGALDFPVTCRLSHGANLCIASLVFWLLAAASSFFEQKAMKEALVHRGEVRTTQIVQMT